MLRGIVRMSPNGCLSHFLEMVRHAPAGDEIERVPVFEDGLPGFRGRRAKNRPGCSREPKNADKMPSEGQILDLVKEIPRWSRLGQGTNQAPDGTRVRIKVESRSSKDDNRYSMIDPDGEQYVMVTVLHGKKAIQRVGFLDRLHHEKTTDRRWSLDRKLLFVTWRANVSMASTCTITCVPEWCESLMSVPRERRKMNGVFPAGRSQTGCSTALELNASKGSRKPSSTWTTRRSLSIPSLGFARDGLFAYLLHSDFDAGGKWTLAIVNLINDKTVTSRKWKSWVARLDCTNLLVTELTKWLP